MAQKEGVSKRRKESGGRRWAAKQEEGGVPTASTHSSLGNWVRAALVDPLFQVHRVLVEGLEQLARRGRVNAVSECFQVLENFSRLIVWCVCVCVCV